MNISSFDIARALKWLKHYRKKNYTDQDIVNLSAKSFQHETGYTNGMMSPIIDFMWKSQKESQC